MGSSNYQLILCTGPSNTMTIKEELKEEIKEEGGGDDEIDALDALEKEAAEYNKVCP